MLELQAKKTRLKRGNLKQEQQGSYSMKYQYNDECLLYLSSNTQKSSSPTTKNLIATNLQDAKYSHKEHVQQ